MSVYKVLRQENGSKRMLDYFGKSRNPEKTFEYCYKDLNDIKGGIVTH